VDPTLINSNKQTTVTIDNIEYQAGLYFGEWIDRQHESRSRTINSLQQQQHQALTTLSSPHNHFYNHFILKKN